MDSNHVQDQLDDLLDGSLPDAEAQACLQHIAGCPACAKEWQSVQDLTAQLRTLPRPQPRPGYEARMLAFLSARRKPASAHLNRTLWFGGGFATAMLALIGVWLVMHNPMTNTDNLPMLTVELPSMQTRKVDLVFHSPHAIESASLRIELPEGTEIAGYPNRSNLEWQTTLKPGTNRLSLPLILKAKNGGTLYARISHSGQTRVFQIRLIGNAASSGQPNLLAS